ncbi:MAG: transposase [Anaerolineales bacterium]|nr:transposase [Anaerolineales bacterium]
MVVVDESGTPLDMTRLYARAPRGERAVDSVLRNYGCNGSLIAALRLTGMTAPFVIEGAVNTAVFEAYTAHVLAPTLQPGDVVGLDNLSCHKTCTVRHLIEARGASVLFLPAYSPDLSPIEQAFAKLKQLLRTVNALPFETLLEAIAAALPTISPLDAIGFFTDCGFVNLG